MAQSSVIHRTKSLFTYIFDSLRHHEPTPRNTIFKGSEIRPIAHRSTVHVLRVVQTCYNVMDYHGSHATLAIS